MTHVIKYLGVVAIIAILTLAAISGSIGQADALKAKNTHSTTHSYGKKNIHKVCGAKLCSSGENPDPINVGRYN
ncbi:MAG: hypothetical protein ACREAK_07525 [Nitrosarchaeum sp.]